VIAIFAFIERGPIMCVYYSKITINIVLQGESAYR